MTAVVHGDTSYRSGYLAHAAANVPGRFALLGGDVRDAMFMRDAFDGADTVFHLAAITSVAYSYAHPAETFATNVLGAETACAAARHHGVRRLVYVSTAGVYGDARAGQPIDEDHPVCGANPYTASKLGAEFAVESYRRSYGLPTTIVRLFNAYGPRMGRYLIMPAIIEQLLAGPELRLGNLAPRRSFTYVEDLVAGLMAAGRAEATEGGLLHLGTAQDWSMQEVVDIIAQLMHVDYTLMQDEARLRPKQSEILDQKVNQDRARELLGWVPRIPLEEGLKRTIAWIRAGGYKERGNTG